MNTTLRSSIMKAIAKCGNSGNTSEPHLHFQLNDGKSFFASAGLPVRFKNVLATGNGKNASCGIYLKRSVCEKQPAPFRFLA